MTTTNWCEMCNLRTDCLPVLIDENMETYMCRSCINEARAAMTIEILSED